MHVHPRHPAITQWPLQPDVVVRDAFVDIQLLYQGWVGAVNLAVDGLIANPEHRVARNNAQSHTLQPAIALALSPCQQMMGGSA